MSQPPLELFRWCGLVCEVLQFAFPFFAVAALGDPPGFRLPFPTPRRPGRAAGVVGRRLCCLASTHALEISYLAVEWYPSNTHSHSFDRKLTQLSRNVCKDTDARMVQ
eukprot:GHVT01078880.1.p1 GENE.GHVT01078880.1~~GHVT01078880.1.p1  ORF type:complete len:108 (+),score=5.77 GHVT01078880.1:1516-1839(+)